MIDGLNNIDDLLSKCVDDILEKTTPPRSKFCLGQKDCSTAERERAEQVDQVFQKECYVPLHRIEFVQGCIEEAREVFISYSKPNNLR